MEKWSLDASFIIDFLSGRKYAKKTLEGGDYSKIVIPSLAKAEIKWSQKDIKDFEKLETLKFGSEEIGKCLEIKSFLEEKGEMINKIDIMIAAQCITSSSILVTRDKDFKNLEEYQEFRQINLADEE